MYKVIDLNNDPRIDQINNFRQMLDPYVSITANVDITELLKSRGTKHFFQTFLYIVTKAVNDVPEHRRRFLGNNIVEYNYSPPSYTLMGDNGVYLYYTPMENKETLDAFIIYCSEQEEIAKKRKGLVEEGDPLGHIFVSCVPWITYTSIKLPLSSREESHVMVEWGKYEKQSDERVLMPLTISANHALADGIHLAQFYENVNTEITRLIR